MTPEQASDARRLYARGASLASIAASLDVQIDEVRAALVKKDGAEEPEGLALLRDGGAVVTRRRRIGL